MNVLNKVTLQTLKRNKVRTLVTIIGIVLSAAMICAVTTFAVSMQNYAVQYAIYTDGDWHGAALDTEFERFDAIRATGEVSDITYAQLLGYADIESQNEFKPYLYLIGGQKETYFDMLPIHLISGEYPDTTSEILLPEHLASNGGVKHQIGDTITLDIGIRMLDGVSLGQQTPNYRYDSETKGSVPNEETIVVRETRTYTVVGFYERPVFEGYTAPGYTAITAADDTFGEDARFHIYFKMRNIAEIYRFMDDMQISGSRNADVLLYSGYSSYSSFSEMLYGLAAIVIGLIMFGSISLIYNAFSISVSDRIKQFGLLSSIGATKRQLRRMVFFEAIAVSLIGIPLGIGAGIGGIAVTLLLIGDKFMAIIGNYEIPMRVCVSWEAMLSAAAIAFVTVMISAWIPSTRATRISAVEAIRQTMDIKSRRKPVRTSRLIYQLFGLPGVLARKHYQRSRKKYRTTVVSLFMSVVLFISASAFTDYLMESVSGGLAPNQYDFSYTCDSEELTDISKDELLEQFRKDAGVTDVAYIQYRTISLQYDITYLSEELLEKLDDYGLEVEEETGAVRLHTTVCFVNDTQYRELLKQHKLDEAVFFNSDNPVGIAFDGNTEFDSRQGKYITVRYLDSDITEGSNGSTTLKAAKTLYEYPYFLMRSTGVIFVYPDSMKSAVLPDMDTNNTYRYLFTSANHRESDAAIKETLAEHGLPASNLYNYAESVEAERNIITIVRVFAYGFIVLISLIAAANVFNTISTNISLRRREFAMLKSVGMTVTGFRCMMNFECLLYGSRALLFGLPVSAGITYLIYRAASNGYESVYRLPWRAVGIAVLSVFTVVFAAMMYSMNRIKKDNPIDTLKNENI